MAKKYKRKNAGGFAAPLAILAAIIAAMALVDPGSTAGGASASFDTSVSVESPILINEAVASNAGSLILSDGTMPDWIELINLGDETESLSGYALVRADEPSKAYTLPDVKLAPGECAVVYADSGSGQMHAPFKLPSSGTELVLLSPAGRTADLVETPSLKADEAWCRDAANEWQRTLSPTPGQANRIVTEAEEQAKETLPAAISAVPGDIEITEIVAANATWFADETGAYPDYIELHNVSDSDVNLEGWYLSDDAGNPARWQFPSVTIPADGYLAVHCSGKDRKDDPNHLHTNFKLAKDGGDVVLTDASGQTRALIQTPALKIDQAYCLVQGRWRTDFSPTPGCANTMENASALGDAIRDTNDVGVIISEIGASTSQMDSDWVELYNAGSETVDLSGYGLSDNAGKPRKWQFPSGTTIAPGEYLGVFLSGEDTVKDGMIHASFRLSADGGYSLVLARPSGEIVDRVFVPQQYQDVTYGRTDQKRGLYYFTLPTPLARNDGQPYVGKAAAPEYSVSGGLYTTGQVLTVEMTSEPGTQIYYTLDNTDPTQSSTLYTGPITISATTILRTRVYGNGGDYLESFMDTQSYLYDVNVPSGVYVVSLVSDPYNLTSDEAGIMVKGPNAWAQSPYGAMNQGANFWMDWEREAHVEVFNADGSNVISQECGIKLHGQFSRKEAQQAFKVIARAKYGSGSFDAELFENRDYTEYQSFLLRQSGQDTDKTRMRDSILTALAEDTSVMYQETELCVVYLDGMYWGHYNVRERINAYSICQFEGWEGDEDKIDLVKANSNVMQGSNETFEALLKWVKSNDMTTDQAYQVLDSAIDIQNYIEYMAVEIFTGNTDTLNVKRYRNANDDGKWRWVLFDLDWAFLTDTNSISRWLTPGGMGNGSRTDNTLFIACMKNPTFYDRFMTYMGQQMATTFSTESVLARIQERYEALEPLLDEHLARWGISMEQYQRELNTLINYAKERPQKLLTYFKGGSGSSITMTDEQMLHYFGEAIAKVQSSAQ